MVLMRRNDWFALALSLVIFLPGCGTPGAPQPPSLNLPDPIGDLSATRSGNQITLTWTMPKRNTDRTIIKKPVPVRVCRRESNSAACDLAGPDQMIAPGASGIYSDPMPAALAFGPPRPVTYFVELRNSRGRSAGLSNPAEVLAGAAPAPIEHLNAEVRKQGVVLRWRAGGENTAVRLERKLLTAAPKTDRGPLAPLPEALQQNLFVDTGLDQGHAIDKTVRFDERYEYRAQRVARVELNGKTLELDGAFSSPVQVDVMDVFPPTVPIGLVTVPTAGENGIPPMIDLSWQPDADSDVAGYVVYRREPGGEWQRLSPPIIQPAFQDGQIEPGHTYQYAVSAVDKSGHESTRSAEVQETVPRP